MNKKNLLIIGLFIIITALVFTIIILLVDENKNPQDEQTQTEPTELTYFNKATNLEFSYPTSWQDKVSIESKTDANKNLITLNYIYPDGKQLISLISAYPTSEINMLGIQTLPNHKVILTSSDFIFTESIPLDFPFEQGSTQGIEYLQILQEWKQILSSLKLKDTPYAINEKLFENKSNTEEKYTVNANLPIFPDKDSAKFNKILSDFREELINNFEDSVKNWDLDEETGNSNLTLTYDIINWNKNFISINFINSEYLIGAAHPNNYFYSFNYDIKNKKLIKFSDLFTNKDYLKNISEIARTKLKEQFTNKDIKLDTENIQFISGTEAKEDNFSNFNLTPSNIQIIFEPETIAPYALGGFIINIDYSEIQEIINPKIPQLFS
jgi:hypothetical protein